MDQFLLNHRVLIVAVGAPSGFLAGPESTVREWLAETGITMNWYSRGYWHGRPVYSPGEPDPYPLNSVLVGQIRGNCLEQRYLPCIRARIQAVSFYWEIDYLTPQQVETIIANMQRMANLV